MYYPEGFPVWLFYILTIWGSLWSAIVLWRSARLNQKNWFILFFVIHTFGILELIYLFYFAKKRLTMEEIKSWYRNIFFTKVKS